MRCFYYYIAHLYSPSDNKIVSNALDAYSNETGMVLRRVYMKEWKLSCARCKEESSSSKACLNRKHLLCVMCLYGAEQCLGLEKKLVF